MKKFQTLPARMSSRTLILSGDGEVKVSDPASKDVLSDPTYYNILFSKNEKRSFLQPLLIKKLLTGY